MIVRPYYLDLLKTYRDVPLVKILAGIRRCGKSTILAPSGMRSRSPFHRSCSMVAPHHELRITNYRLKTGLRKTAQAGSVNYVTQFRTSFRGAYGGRAPPYAGCNRVGSSYSSTIA